MNQRYVTGAIIFLAVIASLLLREITVFLFDAFLMILIVLAVFEFSKILTKMSFYNYLSVQITYPVLAYILLMLSIYLKLDTFISIFIQIGLLFLTFVLTFLVMLIFKKDTQNEIKTRNLKMSIGQFSVSKAAYTLIGLVYPTVPLLLLFVLNHIGNMQFDFGTITSPNVVGLVALVIAFLIPMLTDTFAFISGSLIGGKKLAPKISPNKTISGAVGGVLFTILIMVALFILFDSSAASSAVFGAISLKLWHIILIAFLGSLFSQIGDLFESLLKRRAGVKDSGNLFPGHGGILDRFDSHIFNAIIVFAFFMILL